MRPTRSVQVIVGLSAPLLLAACTGSNGISAAINSASRLSATSAMTTPSAPAFPSSTAAGSNAAPTPPPTSSVPSAPSSVPSATSSATGAAGLAPIVVRLGDLPAGWTAEPYQPDPSDDADQAALLKCVGGRDTSGDKTGEVHSPDFSYDNASVSSQAERYRSDADLTIDQSLLHNPKTVPCYRKLSTPARLGLPAGATLTSVSFSASGRTSGQPSNVVGGLRAVIAVTMAGRKLVIYADSVYIRGPRIEAEIDFTNAGTRVPAAFRAALTAKVAARAARA